ncbi:MAG: prolyl oligopeptidase family serine peptidase [Clostridia bacterium]|nr:prolyl oligopeptidase family serine peptidase [Clostridia bacterium]
MNWTEYQEPNNETYETGKEYRQRLMNDFQSFVENYQKQADTRRLQMQTPKEFAQNREKHRADFVRMLGFPLTENLPYGERVEIVDCFEDETYIWQRMRIEIFPNFYAYGILTKHKDGAKRPFVMAMHGGEGTPELINGFVDNSSNYNHMVRRILSGGVNVFAMQTFLWRVESFGVDFNRKDMDSLLRGLGGSMTALEVCMIQRCLDYFEKQAFVDNERMGIVGLSYGGMFSMVTAAVDTRLKCVYSCSWFNDRSKYAWSDWVYPSMFSLFKDAEIGGLIAPRPLFVGIGKQDALFDYRCAIEEADRLKAFYSETEDSEKYQFHIFEGTHEFDKNEDGLAFFFKYL